MNDTHLLEIFLQRKCWRAPLGKCRPQSLGGSFGSIQGDYGPGVGVHWSAPTDLRIDRTAASSLDCSGLHTHCLLLLGEDGNVMTQTGGIWFIRLSLKVQLVLVLIYRWIQRFTYTLAIYISNYFHKLFPVSWVKFEVPLKASVAPGAKFLSGWNLRASFLYAFFKSSSLAFLGTPRIS